MTAPNGIPGDNAVFAQLAIDFDEAASPREDIAFLDGLLEAGVICSDRSLKERFLRRGNQTASEFLFADLKTSIRELDPEMDPESADFRTAAILLAAAYFVGPHVGRLVQFTGYSMKFVADIAQRMRACGLWSDEGVRIDHWWDGDRITGTFWADLLVAEGLVYVERSKDGEELYIPFDPKSKNPS